MPRCATRTGDSSETAGVKPEEGGDDVKSSWPCRNKVAVGEESGWITSFLRILSIVRMATFETKTVEPELQTEITVAGQVSACPTAGDLIEVVTPNQKNKHGPAGLTSDRADAFS